MVRLATSDAFDANGTLVDVELLRPARWVADRRLIAGGGIDLWLSEIEVRGSGKVISIEPFGELESSSGRVVTGRFKTLRPSELVEVRFADGSTLAGTPNHPLWSLQAGDWTGLGELSPGDQVQAADGPLSVTSVMPLASFESVYNIEVDGEHVYQAGDAGILVHNSTPFDCKKYIELKGKKQRGEDLSPEDSKLLDDLEASKPSFESINTELKDLQKKLQDGDSLSPEEVASLQKKIRDLEEMRESFAPVSGLKNATRLTPDELLTGQRLEQLLGKGLRESPHVGAEYIDDLGRAYDALGGLNASKFWNESKFLNSIRKHLLKSDVTTVIDLTGFTPQQIAAVQKYLATLSPEQLAKIIRIGF
jgi:hypothetical protein